MNASISPGSDQSSASICASSAGLEMNLVLDETSHRSEKYDMPPWTMNHPSQTAASGSAEKRASTIKIRLEPSSSPNLALSSSPSPYAIAISLSSWLPLR